jgi:LmbE family N-acetylglucosaminyl deacetylase
MPKIVLAIVAHPDDAEMAAGGLLAKYARDGHRIMIASVTDGELGSLGTTGPALAARREGESRRAASVIGAAEPIFLGLPDFSLDMQPPALLRERLIRLIREKKPDILVLQDPAVHDSHPDHRALAIAASDAAAFCMLPGICPEHAQKGIAPWFVPEKLFYSETGAGADYFVDITDVIGKKVDSVLAHESQIEFLVADVKNQARIACIDETELASVTGGGALGPEGPAALMAMAIQRRAAQTGARAGYTFGEAYRRVRYHPYIEELIARKEVGKVAGGSTAVGSFRAGRGGQ